MICNASRLCAVILAAFAWSACLMAADAEKDSASATPTATATATPSPGKTKRLVFHGMISEVNQTGQTFIVTDKHGSRVVKVVPKTVLTRDGRPAGMKDLNDKQEVRGQYVRNPDGTLEARTVVIGAKPEAKEPKKPSPTASPTATRR